MQELQRQIAAKKAERKQKSSGVVVSWPRVQEVSAVNPYMDEDIHEEAEDTVPATCFKLFADGYFSAWTNWVY